MSKPEPTDLSGAADQAARWFLRLQESSADAATFIEWQRWLSAAPENRAAYEDIESVVLRLSRVPVMPRLPSAQEMAQDTYDGSQSIAEWKRLQAAAQLRARSGNPQPVNRGWSRVNRFRVAASFAVIALTGGLLWLQRAPVLQLGELSYKTSHGQRRVVELPDGSAVTLDADSALSVQLSAARRSLRLEHGEAYFRVAKDPHRPFVVSAGSTQVTAVGTAFNVHLSDDRTVVAVTEGKVDFVVTPKDGASIEAAAPHSASTQARLATQVAAGEAVSYRDDGRLQPLAAKEAPLATAWLEGRREYRNEPLRYVLGDVDRYTGRRIELASEAAGELSFTGTLNLENSEAWLRGLSVALPVTVTRKEDGVLSIALRITASPAKAESGTHDVSGGTGAPALSTTTP
jgi:transmembrane sensor